MFDLSWGEILVVGVVALIVVGPKELPVMFRKVGQFVGRIQAMAGDFRRAMDQAADDAGVNDIKREMTSLSRNETYGLDNSKDPLGLNKAGEKMRDLNKVKNPKAMAKDFVKDSVGFGEDKADEKPATSQNDTNGDAKE